MKYNLLLRNLIEKVWRYGNKVLSLQTEIEKQEQTLEITRYRIPVLYWHRDSLFFTPLRTNY